MNENRYAELASIDVGAHIEKKNGLSYLSWAWAVDKLLRQDPAATWFFPDPVRFGETLMVFCTVTAFGKPMTAQLPVMDNKNKAIPNPDAFEVNKAMQRCLAKAIALHGIGLYIYAGEDLPAEAPAAPALPVEDFLASVSAASDQEEWDDVKAKAFTACKESGDAKAWETIKAALAKRAKELGLKGKKEAANGQ